MLLIEYISEWSCEIIAIWILRDNLTFLGSYHYKAKGTFPSDILFHNCSFWLKKGTFSKMLNRLKLNPDTTLIFHLYLNVITTCWYAIKGGECLVVRYLEKGWGRNFLENKYSVNIWLYWLSQLYLIWEYCGDVYSLPQRPFKFLFLLMLQYSMIFYLILCQTLNKFSRANSLIIKSITRSVIFVSIGKNQRCKICLLMIF